MNGDQRIRLQIDFWGLCTFVSDKPQGVPPTRMDIVLVEDPHHIPQINLAPRFFFDQPRNLLMELSGHGGRAPRRLNKEFVTIRPGGNNPGSDFQPPLHLNLMPDIKEASGTGKVHDSVVTNTPASGRPVAARVELVEGRVFCKPEEVTANVWSFIPKRHGRCHKGKFALWAHYELETTHPNFVIRIAQFSNPGNFEDIPLTPDETGMIHIQITNLPPDLRLLQQPHTGAYYDLLEEHIPHAERPLPYEVPDCDDPVPSPRDHTDHRQHETHEEHLHPEGVGEIGCSPIKAYRVE